MFLVKNGNWLPDNIGVMVILSELISSFVIAEESGILINASNVI